MCKMNSHGRGYSPRKVSFTINAAGQVNKQILEFVYLGGAITADRECYGNVST